MSAHTKMHHTDKGKAKENSIPWREVFKEEIEKYSEAGAALKGFRYREDMTQKKLAELLGMKTHHISEMENGKRTITKKTALMLAEIFETDYRIFL